MIPEVNNVLQRLLGLPLWSSGRVADLQWFTFGYERRVVPANKGETKIVSEFSLHVQCAWRIWQGNRVLVASRDRAYPAGNDPYRDAPDFDWSVPGSSQLDARISSLFEHYGESSLMVEKVDTAEVGGFSLTMREDVHLGVFPDSSIMREYWRLFVPFDDSPHFVYTHSGTETE